MTHTYYVAQRGRDQCSGTKTRPFATLARAIEAARTMGAGRPRRIIVRGGDYHEVNLVLTPADNGLTIMACPGESPVLYGGRRITGWKRDKGPWWSVRLPGVQDRQWDFRMLWVNGRSAPRARFPQTGRLEHASVFDVPWMSTTAGGWKRKPTEEELTTLKYRPGDLGPWLEPANAELTVYHNWDESSVGVKSIDEATRTIRFSNPSGHPAGAFSGGNPQAKTYVVWNVREGMTEPGQWYLDRAAGKLVYWPLPGEAMNRAEVIAPTTESVIRLVGGNDAPISKITLQGLTLAVATTPLIAGGFGARAFDGAISVTRARDCRLNRLTVRDVAGQGIKLQDCQRIRIEKCETRSTGAGGLCAFQCDETRIADCHIHHNGQCHPSAIGIWITGSRNRIEHNEVHHTTYSGIIGSNGEGTRVERNLIYEVMQVLRDGGAIYVTFCKKFTLRGNVVRGLSGELAHAYYLDEQAENCVVEGNLAVNSRWPSNNHMARDCAIRGNVFVGDGPAMLTLPHCQRFVIEENVIAAAGDILFTATADGIRSLARNVLHSGNGKIELERLDANGYSGTGRSALRPRQGTVIADPRLIISAAGRYGYRRGSPALALGLKPVSARGAGRRSR